jgi:hypothetical protein
MIADEIVKQFDVGIDRRHIMLDDPIKHLGEFIVPLKASADVTGELKLIVEPEVKADDIEQKLIEQDRADRVAAEAEAAEQKAADSDAAEEVTEAVEAAENVEKYEDHETAAKAEEK